jgi:hypothetical protein
LFAACLLLAPLSAADGEELFGLDSRAINITAPAARNRGQFAAAFAAVGSDGAPHGITIQSRFVTSQPAWHSCSTTISLPTPATKRISHPALARSGWLFVTASEDPRGAASSWRLWALRRNGVGQIEPYCSGWGGSWVPLDRYSASTGIDAGTRAIASAPDAIVVGNNTFVFVTGEGGFIDYRQFHGGAWLAWRTLSSTRDARYRGGSKPAVASYTDAEGVTTFHLFWLDLLGRNVFHQRAFPFTGRLQGLVEVDYPTSRPLDPAGRARTACSAGPEVVAPQPLFVVCGTQSPRGEPIYSIARLIDPARVRIRWASDAAVEMIGGSAWTTRNLFGGFSAPSIGPSGIADTPLMLVAYSDGYCREDRIAPYASAPAPGCFIHPLVAEELYRSRSPGLRGWEPTPRPDSTRWGDLN